MTKKKKDIIKSLAINTKDVGSAEVQIGLLSQKINKANQSRPNPSEWREIDYTSVDITSGASETISPFLLQNQNSANTGFILKGSQFNGASANTFNLGVELDLPKGESYGKLNFGDFKCGIFSL